MRQHRVLRYLLLVALIAALICVFPLRATSDVPVQQAHSLATL